MHLLSVPQQIWGVAASSSTYTYPSISVEDAGAMKEQVSESYLLSPTQKYCTLILAEEGSEISNPIPNPIHVYLLSI